MSTLKPGNLREMTSFRYCLPIHIPRSSNSLEIVAISIIMVFEFVKTQLYMNRYGGYPIWENTSAQYFPLGDDMYPVLLEELMKEL